MEGIFMMSWMLDTCLTLPLMLLDSMERIPIGFIFTLSGNVPDVADGVLSHLCVPIIILRLKPTNFGSRTSHHFPWMIHSLKDLVLFRETDHGGKIKPFRFSSTWRHQSRSR